jgi:predicted helicase
LEVYDNTLRKLTGSYYTPGQVVECMVRLVDESLRRPGFGLHAGLASPSVTLADPATGTGTYVLGILRRIAAIVEADQGPGAVKGAVHAALQRLVAFEMQLGPFAVAQLRVMAEVLTLTGTLPQTALRMFVTDTLAHPDDDEGWVFGPLAPIAEQRKAANKIKRDEPVTVVIGNPPYKEKALGRGGWVEGLNKAAEKTAPLAAWMPPAAWHAGAHSKHLRNLYVYFWRWATWKVFDQPGAKAGGIVCFITVAGFLGGPGFQGLRAYLRRVCDEVWVIDCSPDGHQPEVATRIFQGVQQPVCIVLASRSNTGEADKPAAVRWRALPLGPRQGEVRGAGQDHAG